MTVTIKPQSIKVEPFVDDKETIDLIKKIFVGIGLMIGAAILSGLFIWSYNKSRSIFIVMLGAFMLVYSIEMAILISSISAKLDVFMFNVMMGSTIAFGMVALILIIIFGVKIVRDKKEVYAPAYQ